MLADFTGILVILLVGITLACAILAFQLLLGPRRKFAEKNEPFECGESPIVSPHQRYAVKFYMVAILFVVFDVEAVFFYPWAAVFMDLGWYGYVVMLVFTVPLVIGLVYEWMKGGLDW